MNYRFAGLTVDLAPAFSLLRDRAEKYRAVGSAVPDITIRIPEDMLRRCCTATPALTREECEYMLAGSAFYRRLLDFDGVLLHASAVERSGRAYLFSADSGVGKSTHAALWLREFSDAAILNDDKPALRLIGDIPFCCGTPFSGKEDLSTDRAVPVAGIAFLTCGAVNTIERIPPSVSLPLFLRQTIRDLSAERAERLVKVTDRILCRVPAWSLVCNTKPEAAHLSFNTMSAAVHTE